MIRRLASTARASCAAVLVLAGCGQATEAPEATAAADPVPTSGPETTPVGGGVSGSTGSIDPDPSLAQWPATGCEARSVVSVDYGRMPTGFDTPEEAVEHSPAVGLPDGVLTWRPTPARAPRRCGSSTPAPTRSRPRSRSSAAPTAGSSTR